MENRGRTKKEDSKNNQYRLRMSDEESEMLKILSEESGLSRADILRKALKNYYGLIMNSY